jgi:GAF domain-containing protein
MTLTAEQLDTCKEMLSLGREALGLELGIVSHIADNLYTVISVDSDSEVFQAGETFQLKDTLCREVIASGQAVEMTSYQGKAGLQGHPLYDALHLEAYIAAPIMLGEEIWGTVNFTSLKVRDEAFNQGEIDFVRECADSVSGMLESNQA